MSLASRGTWPWGFTSTGTAALCPFQARYDHPALGRFGSADSLVLEPGNPQALNRYAYVYNNPLRYTDPSGHWVETVRDILSLGLTLHDLLQEGLTWENALALAVDVTTAILPGVPAFAGVLMKGGKVVRDPLKLVRGVRWTERFAGEEVLQGLRYLERMVKNPKIPAPYRRGLAAELLRAEQLHKAGQLRGVAVRMKGGRVDFVLITDEWVEFKYWTQSYAEDHIQDLADQLKAYQRFGRPLILELARTKTNPITEEYLDQLLKDLQAAGVRITRKQIRLIDLP